MRFGAHRPRSRIGGIGTCYHLIILTPYNCTNWLVFLWPLPKKCACARSLCFQKSPVFSNSLPKEWCSYMWWEAGMPLALMI